MPQDRHEWYDPRPASDEQEWPAVPDVPNEVATDRPTHLEAVGRVERVTEVWRDLAILNALDGQGNGPLLRW